MTDENIIVADTWEDSPAPEPESIPNSEPVQEHESAPALEPEPAPPSEPDPEESAVPPMEVVTVEDLLDRLTGNREEEEEAAPAEEAEEVPGFTDGFPDASGEVLPIQVVGMETVLERLETIQGVADHPALTTPFENYTVTEGLLLLLFLSVFALACVKLLKGGFAWLR